MYTAIFIVCGDGFADVNHISIISNTGGCCENLSFILATSCASLNHLGGNGGLNSLSQES